MLKTESAINSLLRPSEFNHWLTNKTLVLSSRQMDWNGILIEQYQNSLNPGEVELPALSNHWLKFPLGQPGRLTQKSDERLYESTVQEGDSLFVPAGQPSYWRCPGSETFQSELHIHLQPELVGQVAQASEINIEQFTLMNRFGQQDLQLHQVAMLLLAEMQSGVILGRLYVESLTQVLVIHLLRHYSTFTQTITFQNRSLTHTQLQQAIDYIQIHLNRDLSLAELASVIGISPTYFASLFKQAMGISPHQYVIQQRVERAKLMLLKTDLAIADIALQVGFSSQSHLTQQFKRVTGLTPKQVRPSP
ncbi:helix-turn-helix transcriptional regulator [Chroococcidiopsis sp. FACHB-1243]|uniref:AraC family transcriptional regulator n=1 Tax=Chroococcidiopsis sp. [FACHB-1243] TaxID=2692781 RepID=UPI001782B4B5|nr:AraC family transcriptional regulator [Chroococcidiopsis sp. [FACHB-1243]]MBD2309592.1 helix-turn-helix transcriptional regulator [Chroococcidiopsis sp. [FACHB-1243]]